MLPFDHAKLQSVSLELIALIGAGLLPHIIAILPSLLLRGIICRDLPSLKDTSILLSK